MLWVLGGLVFLIALVLIVSEETGVVSVAQDGHLLRDVDRKTLYDILMTYIAGDTYLRVKRSNLRSDYLAMLDLAEKKAITKGKRTNRFQREPIIEEDPLSAFDTVGSENSEGTKPFVFGEEKVSSLGEVNDPSQEATNTEDISQDL